MEIRRVASIMRCSTELSEPHVNSSFEEGRATASGYRPRHPKPIDLELTGEESQILTRFSTRRRQRAGIVAGTRNTSRGVTKGNIVDSDALL